MIKHLCLLSLLAFAASPAISKPFWATDKYKKNNGDEILDYYRAISSLDIVLCENGHATGDLTPLNNPKFAINAVKAKERRQSSKGNKYFLNDENREKVYG